MPINPNDINTTNTTKHHGITDVYMADNTAPAERFTLINPDGTYKITTRVATQAEADAGTDDKLVMTPLKVKTLVDANAKPTTFFADATGMPNYVGTITPAYPVNTTAYSNNFVYTVLFREFSDGQPITLDLGFGALPVKKSNPDNKQFEVLANQIIQDKLYSVIYNQATNEFNLMRETGNIISISEQATTSPNYAVPYQVFKAVPFGGQMIEVWFDTDSQGSDTLDVGFGALPLFYTNTNALDKPVEVNMLRKQSRYILVWNSNAVGWNVMNYSTSPAPTNTSQLVNDSDFTTNSALNVGLATKQNTLVSGTNIKTVNSNSILGSGNLVIDKTAVGLANVDNTSDLLKPISTAQATVNALKQDKTSVATHTLVLGTTTTSQKIRLNDQTLNSDLDVDTLFSIVPTKDANGKIIFPSGADGRTVGILRNNLIANVAPTLAEFPSPKEGDSAIIELSDMSLMYYQYNSGAWSQKFYVYGRPRTRFGTGLPVLGGSDQAGDTYVRTTDGLPTNLTGSNLVSEFLFTGYGYSANPAAWNLVNKTADAVIQVTGVTTPVVFPVTTLPGTPVFTPNTPATAGYIYQLPDGTLASWNGTQYIASNIPVAGVRYGTLAPVALPTDKINNTYIQNSTGAAGGVLINTFVYNGTAWEAQSAPTGIAQIYHAKHSVGQATTANAPMSFDTDLLSSGTNITKLSATRFRLQPGAYTIQADPGAATLNTSSTTFRIRNITTGAFIGNEIIKNAPTGPSLSPQDTTNAFISVNFSAQTDIEFWALDTKTGLFGQGAPDQTNAYSWIHIEQKGALPTVLPTPIIYQTETNNLIETGAILANNDLFPIVDVSDGATANQSSYMHRVKRLSNSVMAQQEALTNANSGIIPQIMLQNGITVQVDGWIDYNGSYVSPLTLPVPLYDGQIFQVNHLATLPTTILGTNTDSGISTTLNTPNTGGVWRGLAGKYYRIDNIPSNISETGAATYTALDSDHTIILNAPTLQTLTIPASSTVTNREYIIVNNGAVDKILSQPYTRFDGVTTTVIPAQSSITIQSIGALYKQTDAGNFFVGAYSASIPIVKAQGKINLGDFTTAVLQGGAVNVVSAAINSGSGTAFARYDVVLATGAVSSTNYQVNYEIESNTGEVVTATATVLYSTTNKTLTGFQFALREIVGATQNASIRFTVTEVQTLSSNSNSIKTAVNAGQTVQLGNIKIQVPTATQGRGFEIGTIAGTMTANITGQTNYAAGSWFTAQTLATALTTTYQHPLGFAICDAGDYIKLQVRDNANSDIYHIEIYIGSGFNNNVIKISKD